MRYPHENIVKLQQWQINVLKKLYDTYRLNNHETELNKLRSQLPLDRFYLNTPLGWHQSKSEIERKVRVNGEMPYLVIDTGSICRYKCALCYTRANENNIKSKFPSPLTLDQKRDILSVAKEQLGTETIIIEGAGEPSLNSETVPLLEHAIKLKLRAVVFNSGILIERLLPLIIESGGSVGLKFHGVYPEMTPDIYNSILGQADAWEHFSTALSLIIDQHALNNPVFDGSGQLLAMTRVVLDNYVTPQGKQALIAAEEWAYQNNCAMVLAGDIPSPKSANSFDFIDPEEFAWIILQARFKNWLRGWISPGRAHLVSECEQKYGLRITDGITNEHGEVRGNVYGCVGEQEPFMDIRMLHGKPLTDAILKAWSLRRQWIGDGCMPRFNALTSVGWTASRAASLYTNAVDQSYAVDPTQTFEQSMGSFLQCYGLGTNLLPLNQ